MDVIANAMTNAIDAINTVVWGYILIYGLDRKSTRLNSSH